MEFHTVGGSGIDVRCITSFGSLEEMREEWDDFVLSVCGDVYLSFDWCAIW